MNTKSLVALLIITFIGSISALNFASADAGSNINSTSQPTTSQAGTLGSTNSSQGSSSSNSSTKQVTIASGAGPGGANGECVKANNCFSPNSVMISPGDTVTWTNNDSVYHTVTSGNTTDSKVGTLFDKTISPGNTVSVIFGNSGTVNYFCKIHPWIQGKVIVGTSPATSGSPTTVTPQAGTITSTQSSVAYFWAHAYGWSHPYGWSYSKSSMAGTIPSPSVAPSTSPSVAPSTSPSVAPSTSPSVAPSTSPSVAPSTSPSVAPSTSPSVAPSTSPSVAPSTSPKSGY